MARGQITIFLILGILMILAFVFFFYMINIETETKDQATIEKISEGVLSSSSIKYYVITCLDTVSKDALKLAGLQAGRLYNYQASYTSRYQGPPSYKYAKFLVPFRYSGATQDVYYGIFAPELPNAIYQASHPLPPMYPYSGSLVSNPKVENVFGGFTNSMPGRVSSLPALCYTNGSNTRGIKGFEWSCEFYDPRSNNNSIQYYLERYISNKTLECVNLTMLSHKGYNITLSAAVNTSVLFGEDHVFITLVYPIVISVHGQAPFTSVLSYTSEQPVRLKKIYELAHHMILRDSRDIFFDFRNDTLKRLLQDCPALNTTPIGLVRSLHNATCLCPGMNVSRYTDPCLAEGICSVRNYSDVIVITDDRSRLNQEPYVFAFSIENRIPALDYIDESVEQDSFYWRYVNRTYKLNLTKVYRNTTSPPSDTSYNLVSEVGERLQIFPYGLDPDEDTLTYNYSGWKTPIAIYDLTGGNYYYTIDFGRGFQKRFVGSNVSGGEELVNYWQGSNNYRQGYSASTPVAKDAEYPALTLTAQDVGYHWVRINISDNAGLHDWQDIKVQVRCKPDGGRCCNETLDYHLKPAGASCGACKRCDSQGACNNLISTGEGDCPLCQQCENGGCARDFSNFDYGGRCAFSNPSFSFSCCGGRCVRRPADAPWELYPSTCVECFSPTLRCDGTSVPPAFVYDILSGQPCGPTGVCQTSGQCIDPDTLVCFSGAISPCGGSC